ncbi:MAG: nodulation protein NfeD [Candidatus Eremiobacteraeota bacterium]|nr:nodulation protein NfeD [Candidatus Eremiobacteraeota bacterium]
MKKTLGIITLIIILILGCTVGAETKTKAKNQPKLEVIKNTVIITIKGPINPVLASYVIRGLEEAEKKQAICILKMDTPGGLDSSMRKIIQEIMRSDIPVITYVAPEGARAASAGVYIAYACHFITMAHGTNIGAAHPVMMAPSLPGWGGSEDKEKETPSTMEEKITNDAVAYIKAIAQKRKRNLEWAEKAVRKSESISAEEALKLKVIDFIAKNEKALLGFLKNKKVELPNRTVILKPAGKPEKIEMTFAEAFLFTITNPNIAFLLLILGFYGLIYELASPGAIFPGVLGAICLLLGLYSLGTLPISYAALGLIVLAFGLFISDIFVPSHGLLTAGGVVALILGGLMLIPAGPPYMRISKSVVFFVAFFSGAFFLVVIGLVVTTFKKLSVTGIQGLTGALGEARSAIDPIGEVFVEGEIWKAKNISGTRINKGDTIRVVKVSGLRLVVEKSEEDRF